MRDPRSEARRWLDAAREDLAYARHAAAGAHHAPACFYAQQVAEKSVKAVHYGRGARVVLGHIPNGLEAGTPAQAFSQVQSSRALDLAERFIEAAAAVLAEAR